MRYVSWPIKNRADLNLAKGKFEVDIGSLADDQHGNAFNDLFSEVLNLNAEILGKVQSVHTNSYATVSIDLSLNSYQLAEVIYSMGQPEVVIVFSGANGIRQLTVRFDNPSFSLQ